MQNMDLWFGELHTDNVKLSIRVEQQVFHGESEFQHIDVFDSPEFGRFLTSDGSVIFSEKDEFTYDEMIVPDGPDGCPPMCAASWFWAAVTAASRANFRSMTRSK